MSNIVKFTSSIANSKVGKKVIEPDANGYYELVLGALNIENSAGAVYDLEAGRKIFEESSTLMRRIKNGQLRGELGHTKRSPGMTSKEFMTKVFSIDETNVCCHIKEVRLDFDYAKNVDDLPNDCVVMIGLVKPSGPHGALLKEALDNPDENVAFSIRSITNDRIEKGVLIKYLKMVFTWDWVNEPGIAIATKWKKLGIESLPDEALDMLALEEMVETDMCSGFEDSIETLKEVITIAKETNPVEKRQYSKW